MTETIKKRSHGGKRPGAGRPRTESKLYAFRADAKLAAFIETHENKTDLIRKAVQALMPPTEPTEKPLAQPSWGQVIPAQCVQPLQVPFFDIQIVAGFPIPLNNDEQAQDIELLQMLCPHPEASYLIRVQGHSMIEAGVHDGDILIVDKSKRNPALHEIAVCELNGEYTVKRVRKEAGQCWLLPANPDYPDIEVVPGDTFSIWGVVTYIIHKPTS